MLSVFAVKLLLCGWPTIGSNPWFAPLPWVLEIYLTSLCRLMMSSDWKCSQQSPGAYGIDKMPSILVVKLFLLQKLVLPLALCSTISSTVNGQMLHLFGLWCNISGILLNKVWWRWTSTLPFSNTRTQLELVLPCEIGEVRTLVLCLCWFRFLQQLRSWKPLLVSVLFNLLLILAFNGWYLKVILPL